MKLLVLAFIVLSTCLVDFDEFRQDQWQQKMMADALAWVFGPKASAAVSIELSGYGIKEPKYWLFDVSDRESGLQMECMMERGGERWVPEIRVHMYDPKQPSKVSRIW